jgi:uncharacterized protein (TIGR03000 family)
MQWKWTKMLLAAVALVLLVDESTAQILRGRLLGRFRGDNNYYSEPVTTTQPQAMPAQPAAAQSTQMEWQWVQTRSGLFGRRNSGYWAQVPVATQPAQPAAAAAQPQQMEWRYVTYRTGLLGRRTTGAWEQVPVQTVSRTVQPPAGAEPAPMPSPVAQAQPANQGRVVTYRTGILGRRTVQRVVYDSPTGPTERRAFYPAPAGSQPAYIEVRLPAANAEVLFNGNPTTQTGLTRLYVTPALDPQRENQYEVQVKYRDAAGNPVERTQQIKAEPGRTKVVDLTQPANP